MSERGEVPMSEVLGDKSKGVKETNEKTELKAALKLARLETIVLQDSFGRTARKAKEWVERYKPADADDEENRQIMIKELSVSISMLTGGSGVGRYE